MNKIKHVKSISIEFCRSLEYFFTDIDDTLTIDGRIPDFSFSSLWKLHNNGIRVIPVTGRPAGWCDLIARMWPVEAVIGENGAFYFSYNKINKKMKREYFIPKKQFEKNSKKLVEISERILKEVPGAGISADQDYRISDLAVDFCEDVESLGQDSINRICKIAGEEGAFYAVSSIHVNCWFGSFNKSSCIEKYLKENTDDSTLSMKKSIFIGDSPNDEPIFRIFKNSIGVANISDFKERIKHLPAFITENRSAQGFKEAVDVIISKRNNYKQ